MATRAQNPLSRLVNCVRSTALSCDYGPLSDGALLEAFLNGRDETAFELLVKRHGTMVLGVCQRVLGNRHDAEDAFQAVFLVLARKAGAIVPRDLVGNWLHGVAYRTALHARDRLGRYRARERQVTTMPLATATPDVELNELHLLLDRELQALNDIYRVPIVLCELEGRSRREVARQLRIPEGTLSSRLAKGRALLAKRLVRHGFAPAGAALTTILAASAAQAAPAAPLVASTVQAAALAAAGESATGIVSAHVLALSQGVMKTMFLDKLKVLTVMIAGIVLGALGVGLAGLPGPFVQAAAPADPAFFVQVKAAQRDEPEPIDGKLLLVPTVQKELRLSQSQIDRFKAISGEVDKKSGQKRQSARGIQKEVAAKEKEIEQLQKQIAELQQKISEIGDGIDAERSQSLGKAAPEILSAQAVKRLREIQRQQKSLDEVLQYDKMQRMLKLDDEQIKKVEAVLKDRQNGKINYGTGLTTTGDIRNYYQASRALAYLQLSTADDQTVHRLFEVLTNDQKQTLLNWIGEPYQSSSWQQIQPKRFKK